MCGLPAWGERGGGAGPYIWLIWRVYQIRIHVSAFTIPISSQFGIWEGMNFSKLCIMLLKDNSIWFINEYFCPIMQMNVNVIDFYIIGILIGTSSLNWVYHRATVFSKLLIYTWIKGKTHQPILRPISWSPPGGISLCVTSTLSKIRSH